MERNGAETISSSWAPFEERLSQKPGTTCPLSLVVAPFFPVLQLAKGHSHASEQPRAAAVLGAAFRPPGSHELFVPCFLLSFITASYAWTHVIRTPASIQCSVRTVAAVDVFLMHLWREKHSISTFSPAILKKPWFLVLWVIFNWSVYVFVLCCETLHLPEAFGLSFFFLFLTLFWQWRGVELPCTLR